MLSAALGALWHEPAVPAPAAAGRGDRWLVAVLLPVAVAEGLARPDVVWPLWQIAMAWLCAVALLWRSRLPLAMLVLGFGAQTVAGLVPALAGQPFSVLNATACVLLLPYSLARWASGRAVLLGVAFLLAAHLFREPLYGSSSVSMVVGIGFLLFPVALGAAVRFWLRARRREGEQIRLQERERLARDLHDTVAHHVSGILLQARAAVASSDPARAPEVLRTVEEAAKQSLAEMRTLVAMLREGEDDAPAERAPVYGIGDLARLAGRVDGGPDVVLHTAGDLDDLGAPVGTAVFRLVQEAVTNARRHSRDATRVEVDVRRVAATVQVRVTDDGRLPGTRVRARNRSAGGYGLVGMNERVGLLGGSLQAGPGADGGWTVRAVIPAGRR